MLPAIQHRVKSRLSFYNVIPPIGEPIHNFQNRDEELWSTLQCIREMEKTALQQLSPALLPVKALNVPLTVQETLSSEADEETERHVAKGKMGDDECGEDVFEVPYSPSDSEVEFSIAGGNAHKLVFRYSPSDQESSSDSESLSVVGNSMQLSWPENAFEDDERGMAAGERMADPVASMEKYKLGK